MFGYQKVPVISRNRTQEFHLVKLTPRCDSHHPMGHSAGDGVIHHVKTGVPEDDYIVLGNFHHIRQQALRLPDTVKTTVISAVHAVLTRQYSAAVKHIHHSHGQIKLVGSRFSSGHIQLQALRLNFGKLSLKPVFQFQ